MVTRTVQAEDALDLLEFARTGSAVAFERLAQRYAGLVFSVCLRRLNSREDAEDASQAVFLVLARRAKSVEPAHLASWLHGSCLRAASVAARARERRRRHEKEAAQMRPAAGSSPEAVWVEARQQLDAELEALPAKLREAVARHYFAGQSHTELARELGIPEGTVASRIHAGLERLRERLSRRGVNCSPTALGILLASEAQVEVPASLLACLSKLGAGTAAAGTAAGAGQNAAEIANGVLKTMFLANVKMATGLVCAVALAAGGGGTIAVMLADPVVTAGREDAPSVEYTLAFQEGAAIPEMGLDKYAGTREALLYSYPGRENLPASSGTEYSCLGEGTNWRMLIGFRLFAGEGGGLPAATQILEAKLYLYKRQYDPLVEFRPLLAPWNPGDVSWNSAAQGKLWRTPGGEAGETPAARVATAGGAGWFVADLTDSLRNMQKEGKNFGWRIEALNPEQPFKAYANLIELASSRFTDLSLRPKLVLKIRGPKF